MKKILIALAILFNFGLSAKTCKVLIDKESNQMVKDDLRLIFGNESVCSDNLKCGKQTDFGLKHIEESVRVGKDHFGNDINIINEYYEIWKNGKEIKTTSPDPFQMNQSLLENLVREVKKDFECEFNQYTLAQLGINITDSVEKGNNEDRGSIKNTYPQFPNPYPYPIHQVPYPYPIHQAPNHQVNNQ